MNVRVNNERGGYREHNNRVSNAMYNEIYTKTNTLYRAQRSVEREVSILVINTVTMCGVGGWGCISYVYKPHEIDIQAT